MQPNNIELEIVFLSISSVPISKAHILGHLSTFGPLETLILGLLLFSDEKLQKVPIMDPIPFPKKTIKITTKP